MLLISSLPEKQVYTAEIQMLTVYLHLKWHVVAVRHIARQWANENLHRCFDLLCFYLFVVCVHVFIYICILAGNGYLLRLILYFSNGPQCRILVCGDWTDENGNVKEVITSGRLT